MIFMGLKVALTPSGVHTFHPLTETFDIGKAQEFLWFLTGRCCMGGVRLTRERLLHQDFREAIGLEDLS